MTRILSNLTRFLAVALLVSACSDGQMSTPPATPDVTSPTPAVIKSFKVADAKDASAEAKPDATIDAGGDVFLIWEVENATSIEIKDSKGSAKAGEQLKLKDKALVTALRENETFVLTAYGNDGKSKQAKVTVMIRQKEIKILSFTATPEKIRAGEMSRLCWDVFDKTAPVSVMAGDEEIYPGNELPMPTEQAADDPEKSETEKSEESTVAKAMRFLLKGAETPSAPTVTEEEDSPETDSEATVACVDVTPAETTKYTLNVKDGEKVAATQDVTVEIIAAPLQINAFDVQPTQLSKAGEVLMTWRVSPEEATVDIDHNVTKGDKAGGEKKVGVKETTTFTLTATAKDGQTLSKSVTVTVGRSGSQLTAQAMSPSVFAGESAKIRISEGDVSGAVAILDPSGAKLEGKVDGGLVSIASPLSGSYTVDADGARSNAVAIEVRRLSGQDAAARLASTVYGQKTLIHALIAEQTKFDAKWMEDHYGPYRINGMAVGTKGRLYAASTGGVLYFDVEKDKWKLLDPLPLTDNARKYKDAEESHKGCFGDLRKGTRNLGGEDAKNPVVNVVEVCDVVVLSGEGGADKLVLATDFGVFTYANVDARINDCDDKVTKENTCGNKAFGLQGTTKADNLLFGKVVNQIVKSSDGKTLVAAASDGVYVSNGGGEAKSWKPLAGISEMVNSVAVSGDTIYAATDKGISQQKLGASGSWSQVSATGAKAVAVAAEDATILYAGGEKGLQVSRDCGAYFTSVAADVGAVKRITTSSSGAHSSVSVVSANGVFGSTGLAGKGSGKCEAPKNNRPAQQTDPEKVPAPTGTGPATVTPTALRPS